MAPDHSEYLAVKRHGKDTKVGSTQSLYAVSLKERANIRMEVKELQMLKGPWKLPSPLEAGSVSCCEKGLSDRGKHGG